MTIGCFRGRQIKKGGVARGQNHDRPNLGLPYPYPSGRMARCSPCGRRTPETAKTRPLFYFFHQLLPCATRKKPRPALKKKNKKKKQQTGINKTETAARQCERKSLCAFAPK